MTDAKPFFSGKDKLTLSGEMFSKLYHLDYFRTREDAEAWAAKHGGWVEETSPGSIWRVQRLLESEATP